MKNTYMKICRAKKKYTNERNKHMDNNKKNKQNMKNNQNTYTNTNIDKMNVKMNMNNKKKK